MSSPPLCGTAEWSAKREVALLLGLAGGNRHAAQQLWLRKERIKAEASQFASAGAPQASQQPAGCRAKPAPARAQAVPKQKTAAQLARSERSRDRLFQKHLAKVTKVRPRLQAWLRRARANLEQRRAPAPPETPTRPPVAVPESGAELPPFRATAPTPRCRRRSEETGEEAPDRRRLFHASAHAPAAAGRAPVDAPSSCTRPLFSPHPLDPTRRHPHRRRRRSPPFARRHGYCTAVVLCGRDVCAVRQCHCWYDCARASAGLIYYWLTLRVLFERKE